jgi:hypothetical protein
MLECSAILQIRRDPGCAEGVAADRRLDARGFRPSADHAPGIGLIRRLFRQYAPIPSLGGPHGPSRDSDATGLCCAMDGAADDRHTLSSTRNLTHYKARYHAL